MCACACACDDIAPHGSSVSTGESVAPSEARSEAPVKTQKKHKKQRASVPSESSSRDRIDVWLRGTTGDGLEYYYNTVTGGELMFDMHTCVCPCSSSLTVSLISESQWDKPDGFVDESSPSAMGQTQVRASLCTSVSLRFTCSDLILCSRAAGTVKRCVD